MKWLPHVAAGFLAAGIAVTALPPVATAQEEGGAEIRAEAFEEIRDGEEVVRVDVSVENVENLGAFAFVLQFDETKVGIIEEQAFERGEFLGSTGREVLCQDPTVDAGAARYECVTLGGEPAEGASGNGKLASVYFKPNGDGSASFELSRVDLATPPGDDIDVTVTAGQISVNSDDSFPWLLVAGIAVAVAAVVIAIAAALLWMRRTGRERRSEAPSTRVRKDSR
jgi:hypothetical protein